jgi:voltage-gated potassium channel
MRLPASLSAARWRWEWISQLLVVYSVIVFYMEAELTGAPADRAAAGFWLWNERLVVALFSVEYLFRWAAAENRRRYPFTPLALVDMAAVAPSLVGLAINLRSLKLLRILPLLWMLKLYRYNRALETVIRGFHHVRRELAVIGFVAAMVLLFSAVAMHELERQAQPEKFGRLSNAIWWSFVTLTTVGYGDLYPVTAAGRAVAMVTMLVGIGVLGTFISLVGSSLLMVMRGEDASAEGTNSIPIESAQSPPFPRTGRRAG